MRCWGVLHEIVLGHAPRQLSELFPVIGVVAEPLRDAWVIGSVLGPVLNLALSPIERMLKFRVTGTLNKPEMELKHIPKILLVPVQIPLKLFDDIVPDEISNPKSLKNPKQKN